MPPRRRARSPTACTGLHLLDGGEHGEPEKIITPGTLPDSSPVTLSTPGTYYWSVTYNGDSANAPSASTCGTSGEVETVASSTPVPVGAAGGVGLAAIAGAGFLVLQRRRRPALKRANAVLEGRSRPARPVL